MSSKATVTYNNHAPYKALTVRWGFCGFFEFFLLPNRVHAHPSAALAQRTYPQNQGVPQ
jgi:hypothetical protein